MKKRLKTPIDENIVLPSDLYRVIRSQSFYTSKRKNNLYTVRPFCIVSDGVDVFLFENQDGLSLGYYFDIEKPSIFSRRGVKSFDVLMDKYVRAHFEEKMGKIKYKMANTYEDMEEKDYYRKRNDFNKYLKREDLAVYSSHRALYTKQGSVYPIFFVMLPPNIVYRAAKKGILLAEVKEALSLGIVYGFLINNNVLHFDNLSYSVGFLIGSNEIQMPFCDGEKWL